MNNPILHIVHCIDTEGPLHEDLNATFNRVRQLFNIEVEPSEENLIALQNKKIDLGGIEEQVAAVIKPELLAYNKNWNDVGQMLADAMSPSFRNEMLDDFGKGWVYSWHCVDHLGYTENPRHKALGYGEVFRYYRQKIMESSSASDELNWHFHPLSITRGPLHAATSYNNSMDVLLYVISRRIIEDNWFPTTNRPGFHSERPDGHLFFEQWMPFDYANQRCEQQTNAQLDTQMGRFGDWSRAPQDWLGYHPHHDDYQISGNCRRWIFRCLNLGTRLRVLTEKDLHQGFLDARKSGSAIVAFADHDYRDIRPDVNQLRKMLQEVRKNYPEVKIKFSGAEEAAAAHVKVIEPRSAGKTPKFSLDIVENRVHVKLISGDIFGPQPFLAIKTKKNEFLHDNLDIVVPGSHWTYVLDDQTVLKENILSVGIGAAGKSGGHTTEVRSV